MRRARQRRHWPSLEWVKTDPSWRLLSHFPLFCTQIAFSFPLFPAFATLNFSLSFLGKDFPVGKVGIKLPTGYRFFPTRAYFGPRARKYKSTFTRLHCLHLPRTSDASSEKQTSSGSFEETRILAYNPLLFLFIPSKPNYN